VKSVQRDSRDHVEPISMLLDFRLPFFPPPLFFLSVGGVRSFRVRSSIPIRSGVETVPPFYPKRGGLVLRGYFFVVLMIVALKDDL
jgi:hypothetical protein